jgi:hypothetical protein
LKKGCLKRSWERASFEFRKTKKFGTTPLGAQEGKNKSKRPHEKSCGLIVFADRYSRLDAASAISYYSPEVFNVLILTKIFA